MNKLDLINAVKSQDLQLIKKILEANPKFIDEKDERGFTPLLYASYIIRI
jgi:ankyrin repeat protein